MTPDENDLDRLRFAKRSPPRRHEKSTDRVNSSVSTRQRLMFEDEEEIDGEIVQKKKDVRM